MNNSQYYNQISSILIQAGELIMAQRMKYGEVMEKEKNEIVTSADLISNQYIVKNLLSTFPSIPIYSEEEREHKSDAQTRWILDPLDGTTPWVWGNSGFAISLALEKKRNYFGSSLRSSNERIVLGRKRSRCFSKQKKN